MMVGRALLLAYLFTPLMTVAQEASFRGEFSNLTLKQCEFDTEANRVIERRDPSEPRISEAYLAASSGMISMDLDISKVDLRNARLQFISDVEASGHELAVDIQWDYLGYEKSFEFFALKPFMDDRDEGWMVFTFAKGDRNEASSYCAYVNLNRFGTGVLVPNGSDAGDNLDTAARAGGNQTFIGTNTSAGAEAAKASGCGASIDATEDTFSWMTLVFALLMFLALIRHSRNIKTQS